MTYHANLDTASAIAALSRGFRRLKGIGDEGAAPGDEIDFDEWDWEVGVGLYGEFRRAEAEGDEAAMDRLGRWYDRQIARGLPRRQVNSTAPMLALSLLAERRPSRADWREIIRDWADWLHTQMPKTEEGGYQHTVKERDNDGQLWDDTLVMAVLFVAQAGKLLERADWIEDAHYQYLAHIRFLGDRESGLFYHGWTFIGRHSYARALWARGNAWVTIAIPELFRICPPTGAVARYLREVYLTQVRALAALQNGEGLFHTLLDDPASPVEASGTAGIAYGVLAGRREGLIGAEEARIVERALPAILARIDGDGFLGDVSDGTPMGDTLEFYRRIPNLPTPYGQALGSLFLMECERAAQSAR
ncbi:glycoside hydrolase family 105 protein [Poseidonocella sp. HB161398]|uniref:beta-galactosidase BglB n=1 Tax=Poseidonocella sp. HB161398 TaxID=2320855 RepID=UPI00110A0204|nr:glycoside hydrolase family 88 protein [Poseidonocella sp. HB161398]